MTALFSLFFRTSLLVAILDVIILLLFPPSGAASSNHDNNDVILSPSSIASGNYDNNDDIRSPHGVASNYDNNDVIGHSRNLRHHQADNGETGLPESLTNTGRKSSDRPNAQRKSELTLEKKRIFKSTMLHVLGLKSEPRPRGRVKIPPHMLELYREITAENHHRQEGVSGEEWRRPGGTQPRGRRRVRPAFAGNTIRSFQAHLQDTDIKEIVSSKRDTVKTVAPKHSKQQPPRTTTTTKEGKNTTSSKRIKSRAAMPKKKKAVRVKFNISRDLGDDYLHGAELRLYRQGAVLPPPRRRRRSASINVNANQSYPSFNDSQGSNIHDNQSYPSFNNLYSSNIENNENITADEIVDYRHRISIYEIVNSNSDVKQREGEEKEEEENKVLLDSRVVYTAQSRGGWESFNVRSAFTRWMTDSELERDKILEVQVTTEDGLLVDADHHLRLRRSVDSISDDEAPLREKMNIPIGRQFTVSDNPIRGELEGLPNPIYLANETIPTHVKTSSLKSHNRRTTTTVPPKHSVRPLSTKHVDSSRIVSSEPSSEHFDINVQPILVAYTDDKRTTSTKHSKRAAGQSVGNVNANRKKNTGTRTAWCRRHSHYVDFVEVEWDDWIIAPPGYDAFFCNGSCPTILPDHLNATNHAQVQSLYHSIDPRIVPGPCCVATELSPISMLYIDETDKVVLRNYPDMVAESCGCR